MAGAARAAIELGAGGARHVDALVAREPRQRFELRMIALLDEHSFDARAVGAHGFADGLHADHEAHRVQVRETTGEAPLDVVRDLVRIARPRRPDRPRRESVARPR